MNGSMGGSGFAGGAHGQTGYGGITSGGTGPGQVPALPPLGIGFSLRLVPLMLGMGLIAMIAAGKWAPFGGDANSNLWIAFFVGEQLAAASLGVPLLTLFSTWFRRNDHNVVAIEVLGKEVNAASPSVVHVPS